MLGVSSSTAGRGADVTSSASRSAGVDGVVSARLSAGTSGEALGPHAPTTRRRADKAAHHRRLLLGFITHHSFEKQDCPPFDW
jgi:hypothetical protein